MPASSSESKSEHGGLFEAQTDADNRSDGHILRHFFDDWPRRLQDPDNSGANASPLNTASLPGSLSLDVSLKLATGKGDQLGTLAGGRDHQLQPPLNWIMDGWATAPNRVASMGGPLADALRSSSTTSTSPTSVLHQLTRGSTSEISYVSTWI
ncbi:Growth-regulating factor 3 [Hibiscus syriacus]|uniref:Growth-regulating factor 3 n=1 Tax=Hibiscus syriacus TaxID=106335 RepID=A0A6A2WXJ9_HIBSY|nr:growth-regulating factor 3-like [Hibiscus syriacus]KAE8666151.1 Growth-regulating factor 3 [Hibiscus syriacus]